MDTRFLEAKRKRIAYLFENVPVNPSGSLEVQSHWAKYTCVVISGYIEDSVKELLRLYVSERCQPELANYIQGQLRHFQTAYSRDISELLMAFSKSWETSFIAFLSDERKAAINSVVGNRHRVAHGVDCSVTISQLRQWYPKINEVIDFISALLQS